MANDLNNLNPRKIAIKEEVGKSMTYMDLHHISNAYANKFYELGVRKGIVSVFYFTTVSNILVYILPLRKSAQLPFDLILGYQVLSLSMH